ncbi:hypothetical protein Tco_1054863 [Tanacetum coccineum]|uniref:Uncharacterized protein n=1 Tax=Tanacetum coccineum TaxID=301880 RepID=A0ABQ5GY03_9ASTR
MFVELMDKRKKNFTRLRAGEQRRKPLTKAQKRSQMSTYLKHMAGYKQNQLKRKNYDEIQKLFDKAMIRVNMFVGMDTELVKESSKKAEMVQESSSNRAGEELESDNSKKQKLDDSVEVEVDDEAEMKKHMEIVFDDEIQKMNIKFRGGLLRSKGFMIILELILLSAAGIKVNAPGYNALKDYNY